MIHMGGLGRVDLSGATAATLKAEGYVGSATVVDMLPAPDKDAVTTDPYGSGFYRVYLRLLEKAIRPRSRRCC